MLLGLGARSPSTPENLPHRAELGRHLSLLSRTRFQSTWPPKCPCFHPHPVHTRIKLTQPLAFLTEPKGTMRTSRLYTLVLVLQPQRVLLGMKKRGFGAGRWNGFGGKVQEGETVEDGAKR